MNKIQKQSREWFYSLLPVVLAIFLYADTIPNKYCLDDYCVIVNNTYVQAGIQGIPKILTTNFFNGFNGFNDGLYRPAPLVTYAMEYAIAGLNPGLSHFINLLLFALVGYVLYLLLKRICRDMHHLIPLSIAMLYIANPVHTEVVGSIKGRDDLLAFLFGILAMYYFLKFADQHLNYTFFTGLGFYLLALLSKESSLMLLFVIPLMIFLFTQASKKKQWGLGIILLMITLAWLIWRYYIIHSMPNPVDKGVFSTLNNSVVSTEDITSRLATALYLQLLYIIKLILPFPLSYDYSYNQIPVISWVSIKLLLSVIVLSSIALYLIFAGSKNKLVLFGILFYFLTIATVSNILVYIGATFGERFLFTPSFGFSLVTGTLLALLLRDIRKNDQMSSVLKNNKLYTGLLIIILVTYSWITMSRNLDWKDNYTLFSKDVSRSPNSARAHYNYGSDLIDMALIKNDSALKKQMLCEAVSELNRAVSIFPFYIDAYNNLGNAYANLGLRDSAIYNYAKTIQFDSNYQKGYYNLGINLYAAGQFRQAIPCLVKYAMFHPDAPRIFFYIGNAYGSIGDFDKAIACFERCIAMDGRDVEALLMLGKAFGLKGKLSNSLEIFSQALRVDGNNIDALFNIGLTYSFLNQPEKSIEFFQKAIQLKPGFKESYIELAKAYNRVGDKKSAALYNKLAAKIRQ